MKKHREKRGIVFLDLKNHTKAKQIICYTLPQHLVLKRMIASCNMVYD